MRLNVFPSYNHPVKLGKVVGVCLGDLPVFLRTVLQQKKKEWYIYSIYPKVIGAPGHMIVVRLMIFLYYVKLQLSGRPSRPGK